MKKNLVILVAAFAVLIACGPKKDTKLKTYRFIDHLAERGIIVSPLRNIPFSGVDDRDSYYPVRSAPMNDLGSGENPLDLKRKLSLGLVDYNILFSPPESRYEYTVDIPENAKLEFERKRQLLEEEAIPQGMFDAIESQYRLAQAQVESARAQVNLTKKRCFQNIELLLKPLREFHQN